MEDSHIFLSFFIIISLVFIVSADDDGYEILSYGENFPAYPWQRVNNREWIPRMQTRKDPTTRRPPRPTPPSDDWVRLYPTNEMEKGEDGVYRNPEKRTSTFEEKMAELNNFGRGSGVKVIYGRVPVPVIMVPSYDNPQH